MTDCPVLIAGAGPVGLMLACELGRAGVPAVVVDRKGEPEKNWRVTTFHQRSLDLFDQQGLGEEVRRDGFHPFPAIHFGLIYLDLAKVDGEDNYLVELARVEELLTERAVRSGIQVLRGREVVGVAQDDESVTVQLLSPAGEETITCGYLAGCDGPDSAVRELVGFDVVEDGPSWYGVLADFAKYDGKFEVELYPGGVFGAMPDPPRGFRLQTIEFDQAPPPAGQPVTPRELLANIERLTGRVLEVSEPLWMRRYSGRTRYARQYRKGRVFIAGDAAHNHLFTAGHGLNTGFHDAANLGWKLAAELAGSAPAGLLASYSRERQPVGERACWSMLAQMSLMHPLPAALPVRRLFAELAAHDVVTQHLIKMVTDVSYQLPDEAAAGHPLLGRQVPNLCLKAGEATSTASTLESGRGVVLDFSQGQADLGFVRPWADRVNVVAAYPDPGLNARLVLLRPDGFVAWASDGDATSLEEALRAWFGERAPGVPH